VRKETLEEYFSTVHWKPIIHGYVSYPPLLATLLRKVIGTFPSEESLQVLQRVGVDTVVVHLGREGEDTMAQSVAALAASGRLQPLAHFARAGAHVYAGARE